MNHPSTRALSALSGYVIKNEDGTSNLVLQGLFRVQVNRIVQESPYRIIDISPLESTLGAEEEELDRKKETAQQNAFR